MPRRKKDVKCILKSVFSGCKKQKSGCVVWQGSKNDSGYGVKKINGELWYVHRFVYAMTVGVIPNGYELHHECGVKTCVNFRHIRLVTKAEHNRIHHSKVNFSCGVCGKEKTYYKNQGRWRCKFCNSAYVKKHKSQNKRKA